MMRKMVLKSKYRLTACLVVCSLCLPAIADTKVMLQPKLCIKKKVTDFCDVSVDIQWKTDKTNDHCIVNKSKSKEVGCWPSSTTGNTSDQAHTKVDLVYALLSNESGNALATETLNVLSLKDDSQNNSRRRRHVWSLF